MRKAARHDAELEEVDVEAALKIAEYMFRHLREIWGRLGIEWRIRFQNALFPELLSYGMDEGFGTVVNSCFVNMLR